ncbi:MAG TPA: hypothetical protein VLH56_08885 [Dissulfurispiraceae bacterium]|nr:hypothetical protein [Dissulfurispiraceae bacterium]
MLWDIVAKIGGLAGISVLVLAVIAYFKYRFEIRKITSDARLAEATALESIQRAAIALIAPLERRLDALQAELQAEKRCRLEMEITIGRLRKGVGLLIAQLEHHGITPCWKLEDDL